MLVVPRAARGDADRSADADASARVFRPGAADRGRGPGGAGLHRAPSSRSTTWSPSPCRTCTPTSCPGRRATACAASSGPAPVRERRRGHRLRRADRGRSSGKDQPRRRRCTEARTKGVTVFLRHKKLELPTPDQALPGRPRRDAGRRHAHRAGHPAARARGRPASRSRSSAWAASGAPSASSGSCPGVYSTVGRLRGRLHRQPDLRGDLLRHDRARRGGPGRLRPGEDRLRAAAEGVLGEPRPDPGHAPGQRRRHPVPLGDLHDDAGAGGRREGVPGGVPAGRHGGPARARSPPRSRRWRRSSTPRTTTSSTCRTRRTRTATATTARTA